MSRSLLWEIAEHELRGVGDAALGEWREVGEVAVHLRRRVTAKEMQFGGIEAVSDIRGTPEFSRRIQAMRPFLPPATRTWPDAAFP